MGFFTENKEWLRALEQSKLPIAVYQFKDGKVVTVLVSFGLISMQRPGCTKEDLLKQYNEDMYVNVHPSDARMLVAKAKQFIGEDGGVYDAIYREKLYGKDTYSVVHSSGYHYFAPDGERFAIIYYDDISGASDMMSLGNKIFGETIADILSGEKNAYNVVDLETHELLFVNGTALKFWGPVRPFDVGVTLEEFFLKPGTQLEFSVEEVAEKGDVIAADDTGREYVISGTVTTWMGRKVVVIKATEDNTRFYDALTGLPNLSYYRVRLPKAYQIIKERGERPSIIYTDVIGMRRYNDMFGFEAGDNLLKTVAASFKKNFPDSWVFRAAADHFIVVTGKKDLFKRLSDVNEDARAISNEMTIEICAGVLTPYDDEKEVIPMVLQDRAKSACEVAEKAGHFKVLLYDHELERDVRLREYVIANIDKAISEGWIKPYYQPVVRTISETFCGMEALARWVDPVYGMLNPGAFIDALESSRQIHKLDMAIIEQVCRDMRHRLDDHLEVAPVSFNLSRLDFISCDILAYIERTVKKYRIPRELLHIEITESIMTADSYIRDQVKRFRKTGYEVWMDDFGSGYSSLNVLKDYEFDELKIDMKFISSMSETSRTIVRSVVRMAKELGVVTLAEGVETKEQFSFLRDIGCQKVQGYYFGKPAPLEETMAKMEEIKLELENDVWRNRYSIISRVDFLAKGPMAVLIYDGKKFSFIYSNEAFEKELKSVGLSGSRDFEHQLNDVNLPLHGKFLEFEAKMFEAGHLTGRFEERGAYMAIISEKIYSDGDYHAYSVSITNTNVAVIDKHEAEHKGVRRRVLIADADHQERMLLGSMLEDDYDVIYAADGIQALDALRANADNLDVGIFDLLMPGMNGFEAIRTFRQEGHAGTSFIMLSDDEVFEKRSVELGAAMFLQKPIPSAGVLKAIVKNAIDGFRQLQEAVQRYMEYMPGGVLLFKDDEDEEIVYTNQHLLDLFECETKEEFSDLVHGSFSGAVYEEDYKAVRRLITAQASGEEELDYVFYRIKTKSGKLINVQHWGRRVDDPQYGTVFVALLFTDTSALMEMRAHRSAFDHFMNAGVASGKKAYDPDYKSYLYWNLTKNSTLIKDENNYFIPEAMRDNYTLDSHRMLLSTMMETEKDLRKLKDITREFLLQAFAEGREILPFTISYHVGDVWFSVRAKLAMMENPDTGDVYLRIQNENDTKSVAYERLVDAALSTFYRALLYVNVAEDALLYAECENGRVKKKEMKFSEFFADYGPRLGIDVDIKTWMKFVESRCGENGSSSFVYHFDDGLEKRVDIKRLYKNGQIYLAVVSNRKNESADKDLTVDGFMSDVK